MKTIVARFTEMKKAPTGIAEVEGEEVNVNKVEAALKSVGVQLRDTTGQFRNLDDVFLELSSKWDSLDKMSQRYVATTAAGSRQQSRFIAMMSNYQRTMELTGYATNSAGASQKQFEKTMDSLESKLNRLHDAWEQYVTGMANQSAIKGIIDLLTDFISGVNKLTDAVDPAKTGIAKLIVTILGFKAAKGVINGVVKNLGAQLAIGMGKKGAETGASFSKAFINKVKNIKVGVVGSQSTKDAALANKELAAAQQEAEIATKQLTNAQEHLSFVESKNAAMRDGRALSDKNDIAIKNAKIGVQTAEANVTEANNKVKEKEIAVNELVANSENRLQRVHSLSILQRLNLARVMIFGSAEKKKQILMNYGLATSEEADAIASGNAAAGQTAFNIALEACPIMWIITAVAALIAGLVLLCSWLDKTAKAEKEKYEARIEGAAKATEDAAEKAKEAKEAFDELLENKGTYNKLQEELKNLVKGSDEYLQKTQEIKDIVDTLVKTNPKVGKYVTYDENGVPTISPEGQKIAEQETKKQAYLMEIQSQAGAMHNAWEEYMKQFSAGGEEGYVVAGKDLIYYDAPEDVVGRRRFTGYRYDREDSGLSTKWFQKLAEGYLKKYITATEDEMLQAEHGLDYEKIGSYYITKDFYEKIRHITGTESGGLGLFSEAAYKAQDMYYLDDSSLAQAIDQLYKNSKEVFSTLNERIKYAYKSALMTSLTQDNNINLSQAEAFSNFYSEKIMNDSQFASMIDNFNKKFDEYSNQGIEELQKAYEKNFGKFDAEAAGIEESEDTSDEEKEKNKEAKKGYMASRLATQETFGGKIQDQAETYFKLMKDHTEVFTNVLTIASKNIDDTINDNLLKSLLQYNDVTKVLNNEYRQVLESLEISEEDFEQLWEKAQANVQQSFKNGTELFFKDDGTNSRVFTQLVEERIGKRQQYNFGYLASTWKQQIGQLEEGLNFDTSNLFSKFFNTSLFENAEATEETYKRLSQIDFSKPTQAAKQISNLAKDTNKEYAQMGKYLKTTTADIISLSRQTKYVWKNIDDNTMKDLFEDGAATSDEIKKLCEQLPEMAALLDVNSISASTLAKYFNQVQSGMLDIETTSANYLLALDKVNKAQNMITDSLDFVKSFEASESQQVITDTFSDWRASMQQSLTRGQFGDQNLIDYTKTILGLENWEKYYIEFDGNLQKIEELAFSKINLWKDNFYNLWADFAGKSALTSLGSSGEILFDLSGISSIDEIKQQLIDTYGFSEKIAEAAIADAQTYSSELGKALKQLSLGDSISTLLKGGIKDNFSKTITIDKNEFSSIATEAGKSIQELIRQTNESLEKSGFSIKLNDLLDESGQLSQEAIKNYISNFKKELNDASKNESLIVEPTETSFIKETVKSLNLDKIYSEMLSSGMKPDQIKTQIKNILVEATKDLSNNGNKVFYYLKDGVLKAYTGGLKDKAALAKALNTSADMIYESVDDAYSKGILNALGDEKIKAQKELDSIETMKQTARAIAIGIKVGEKLGSGQAVQDWATKLYDETGSALDAVFEARKIELQGVVDSVDDSVITEFEQNFSKNLSGIFSAYLTPESQKGWTDNDKENKENTKEDTWENDWDRQYDTLKRIEALERKRNNLNKELDRYLKKGLFNEQKIFEMKEKQRKNLTKQIKLNEQLAKDADSWLRGLNNDGQFDGTIWWDEQGETIRTNDAQIRAMDEETKKSFDKIKDEYEFYYNQRNTALDNIDSAVDAIEELTEAITELDYHNNTERLISVIERTIDLYDKAAKRLEWTERSVSSQDIMALYDARNKEAVEKFRVLTDDFIQTEAEINAMLYKSDYQKYYRADWKTGKVTTTGAFDALADKTSKDMVREFVDKLNDLFQRRNEADSQRIEIQEDIRNNQREYLDKAEEFNKNVYDAIVSQREAEISKLENINSSIQSAASDLVSSIQKNIQKIRQDRTNKKTEEELYKMQSKLDFLQMDTSSGNQKAILDLRKQLEDKEQSYTDSLIDQKISELQDQNTEAEKQRKQQIEIMKTQLDVQKDSGLIWNDVRYLIANGLSRNGNIREGSDLDRALKEWGKYSSLSTQGQKDWLHTQNVGASTYDAYYNLGMKQRDYNQQLDYSAASAKTNYNTMQQNMVNAYKQGLIQGINKTTPYKDYMHYDYNSNRLIQDQLFPNPNQDKAQHDLLENAWYQAWDTINTINNIDAYFKKNKGSNIVFTQVPAIARFATGGIADFTGPAWLDGTKTSPELVLNAKDTENFIQLKDILSNIMNGKITKTDSNGDCYFEIHIDVDKISNDYDVDKMAERIKQQIVNSARYRNVNTINLLR